MARPVRMRRLRGFLATVATPLAEGVAGRALPGWLKDMTLRWCEGGLRGRAGGGGDAETAGRTVRRPAADVRRGVSAVPRGEGRSRARSHEAVRGADGAVRGAEGPGMEGARLRGGDGRADWGACGVLAGGSEGHLVPSPEAERSLRL